MIDWLFTTALAALVLAIVAAVFIWMFRPSPAVRHALWLVVVLKLISPTGLMVSVPLPVTPPAAVSEAHVAEARPEPTDFVVEEELFTVFVTPRPGQSAEEAAVLSIRNDDVDQTKSTEESETAEMVAAPAGVASEARAFDYRLYLLAVWVLGALIAGWWQVRGTIRFARFARRGMPASDLLVAEVAIVANRFGVRMPSVRVLTGLTSPVIWCLWRPVLLWPAGLEGRLKGEGRRAVLAHELAHIRRRDHWVRRLEMVAAILHWWNPIFWIARKKLRTDAELACDAWAAGHADRRAYAEALLEVCSFNPRRRPAPAVGVIGEGRRDMQERLTMIMRDRGSCRLAFGAKLIVALMAIAAVPAWTLGQSAPVAPATPTPSDPQIQAIESQIKALSEKLEAIKAQKGVESQKKALEKANETERTFRLRLKGLQSGIVQDVHGQKAMAAMAVKVVTAGEGGYKVIGPDGKELKDVKIIVVDPKTADAQDGKTITGGRIVVPKIAHRKDVTLTVPAQGPRYISTVRSAGAGHAVTLSRATYKLGKDQAAALATLLGSIKATVMETKVDEDSITVTTTPEAQAAIGQIVRLIHGQSGPGLFRVEVAPGTPERYEFRVVPAVPATPEPPTPPPPPPPPPPLATPKKPAGDTAKVVNPLGAEDIEVELKIKSDHLDKVRDLEKLRGLEKRIELLIPATKQADNAKPREPAKR